MQNFFDFTGKVVLVTGASSCIGRATAELFGRCGASVAITYLNNKTGADETVPATSAGRARALAVRASFSDGAEIEETILDVGDGLGPVVILVNNAGSLVERLKTL